MRRKSNPPTIREAVRAAAESRGLTAAKLAEAAGSNPDGSPVISAEMVRLYLKGQSDLASRRLDALFRALGLRVG
jgi:transcriptional regulator with XRE-family HTH domain